MALRAHMHDQALEQRQRALDPLVAGREHLEGLLEADRGGMEAGKRHGGMEAGKVRQGSQGCLPTAVATIQPTVASAARPAAAWPVRVVARLSATEPSTM